MAGVRSIAVDSSSRTSIALLRVLCARHFGISPALETHGPDLDSMLARCDAALIIGDCALFVDPATVRLKPDTPEVSVWKIDLGETWTALTGLPFVYAFWAGRPGALTADDVKALVEARDEGVRHPEELARGAFPDRPDYQAIGARYLRDNIKYVLGAEELAGLEMFYRYAAEAGAIDAAARVRFY
jgi:chorismate dehydratase